MVRKVGLLMLFALVIVGFAQFQAPKVVTGKAFLDVDKVRHGSTFRVALVVTIKKGYHLQAPKPPEGFIATALEVKAPKGFKVVRLWYPPTVKKEVLGQKLPLYEGEQIFAALLRAGKDVKLGKHTLSLTLHYQACDDKACYPPTRFTVTLPVQVVPTDAKVKPINERVFRNLPKDLKSKGVVKPSKPREKKGETESVSVLTRVATAVTNTLKSGRIGWALVLLFLGGLMMNLSPCVLPMVPVVVGYFGRQAEGILLRRFLLGFSFFTGLVGMYAIVGTIAAVTRQMFGSFLQDPWVLLFVTVVLVVLALGMFGLFELKVPQSATQGFQKGVELVGAPRFVLKLFGAFLMGLLLGVIAAPCIGPAIIALLGAAPLLDAWTLFLLFMTLAIGLALPYLILAVFISAAQKLRSGPWTVWVNRFFGVVLLVAAVYFGIQTAYGFGWLKTHHPFKPYTPEALEQAKRVGKPVIIDFWAAWCLPCKELEHKTFSDPRVKEKLKEFLTLQVDLTTRKNPIFLRAAERFQVRGVPTVVFIDRTGRERKELRLMGFEPPQVFLRRLEKLR